MRASLVPSARVRIQTPAGWAAMSMWTAKAAVDVCDEAAAELYVTDAEGVDVRGFAGLLVDGDGALHGGDDEFLLKEGGVGCGVGNDVKDDKERLP